MRQEIKDAVARGDLPRDAEISVTSERFAGGSAINIKVRNWPAATVPADDSLCTGTLDLGRVVPSNCKSGNHDWRCPAAELRARVGELPIVRRTIVSVLGESESIAT